MIEILRAGMQTIVVDAGRYGYRHLGVATCGALDLRAYQRANALVANADEAALEIPYGSFSCRFTNDASIALTGARCEATLNGRPVSWDATHHASSGDVLAIGVPEGGARAYLAVRGGLDVPIVMGSRSTDLRGGFGGFLGRALRIGDAIAVRANTATVEREMPEDAIPAPVVPTVVPATSCDAPLAFWQREWTVTHESNRMGCRLRGEPLAGGGDVDSHAVFPGVVQLPASGEPIVLLADAQTLGGYRAIAVVAPEALPLFGQLVAGSIVRFIERAGDAD